jgi:putative DNA primase/helicase
LQEVLGGGPEVLDYVQMAVGYSLTGHTREEKLFSLYGSGRNGKGAFTETLLTLLGEPLAKEVSFGTFTQERDHDAQNFDLAPLKPARFIAASESSKYERLNEAKVKQLTGGNEVYCAHKHKPHFSYRPQFKIWLSSNYDVNADPSDRAVWSRIVRIVFPHSFEGQEDTTLKERLKRRESLAGVLAWAVEGAKRWYASPGGLQTPQAVLMDLQMVRAELNVVQQWLDEHTEQEPTYRERSKTVYSVYVEWCKANGHKPLSNVWFGRTLKEKGYIVGVKIKGKSGRYTEGLRVRPHV